VRTTLNELIQQAKHSWHGFKLGNPDWSDDSHSLALYAELPEEEQDVYLVVNAYWEPLDFELPPLSAGRQWHRWIDTSRATPEDIVPWQTAPSVSHKQYRVGARSVVVLIAEVRADKGSS